MEKHITKTCKKHGEGIFEPHKVRGKDYYRCQSCRKEYQSKSNKKNVVAVLKRRRQLKELAVEYKGGKCERCGYNKCIRALDFHHLDPSKKAFSVSGKGLTRSWDKLKVEIDKCILVCANCHREIHDEENTRDEVLVL